MRAGGMGRRGMEGAPRAAPDGPATRTVYVLEKDTAGPQEKSASKLSGLLPRFGGSGKDNPTLKPITIKTGISDGSFTEILEGLTEGDIIVVGVESPAA